MPTLSRWAARASLARQLQDPGSGLVFTPLVAVLLGALSATPPWQRLDRPLLDIAAGALVASQVEGVQVIDIGRWVESGPDPTEEVIAARAALRHELALALRLLARNGGGEEVVGLDVLLADGTLPEADAALADAISASPHAVFACDPEAGLAAAFAGLSDRCADADIVSGPDGVTRFYRAGGERASLGAAMARELGARRFPHEVLLQPEVEPIALPLAALLEQPQLLSPFPARTAWFVGLAGSRGAALDGAVVVSPSGYRPVSGAEVHAAAARRFLSGRAVARGGPGVVVATTLVVLLAAAGASRLGERLQGGGVPRRRSATIRAAVAATFGLLALPLSTLMIAGLAVTVSPLALLVGPAAALVVTRIATFLLRHAHYRRRFHGLLRGQPRALVRSFEAATLTEEPLARLGRVVSAYEDLVHYLVICLLTTRPLPRKRMGTVRVEWHRQHTLQTTLATLAALDPALAQAIAEHSRLDADEHGRDRIRDWLAPVPFGWEGPPARRAGGDSFVDVRNLLAHDSVAGIDERAAGAIALILQRALRAILALGSVQDLAAPYRLIMHGADRAGLLRPRLAARDGSHVHDAYPWLVGRTLRSGRAGVYRYRGVAARSGWREHGGRLEITVVYSELGPAVRGLPERLLVPLAEVWADMPEPLRPSREKP